MLLINDYYYFKFEIFRDIRESELIPTKLKPHVWKLAFADGTHELCLQTIKREYPTKYAAEHGSGMGRIIYSCPISSQSCIVRSIMDLYRK